MLNVKYINQFRQNGVIVGSVELNNQPTGTYFWCKDGCNCPHYCTLKEALNRLGVTPQN